jgi:hypothetical protein
MLLSVGSRIANCCSSRSTHPLLFRDNKMDTIVLRAVTFDGTTCTLETFALTSVVR